MLCCNRAYFTDASTSQWIQRVMSGAVTGASSESLQNRGAWRGLPKQLNARKPAKLQCARHRFRLQTSETRMCLQLRATGPVSTQGKTCALSRRTPVETFCMSLRGYMRRRRDYRRSNYAYLGHLGGSKTVSASTTLVFDGFGNSLRQQASAHKRRVFRLHFKCSYPFISCETCFR